MKDHTDIRSRGAPQGVISAMDHGGGRFSRWTSRGATRLARGTLLVLALAGATIFADAAATAAQTSFTPVPDDSRAIDPDSLFRIFANRTDEWGGGSGMYWKADGTWRAVNVDEQSVGLGEWYVTTASRMCYEGRWYWRQDFGVESSTTSTCTRYRVDADGQIWSTTGSLSGPWFTFDADNFRTGDTISAGFSDLAGTLGLLSERP